MAGGNTPSGLAEALSPPRPSNASKARRDTLKPARDLSLTLRRSLDHPSGLAEKALHLIALFEQVDQRALAEAERSEERYRLLFEQAPLVVVEAKDKNEAAKIGAEDPYAKAGLFESVRIRAWNWTFNNPANPSNP